jgi:hypothetical protein
MDMGKEFDAGYDMGLVAGEGYFAGRSSWGCSSCGIRQAAAASGARAR